MTDDVQSAEDFDPPKWDEALAALIRDEYRKLGRPLTVDDFARLAKIHAIRFDDIMETVFKLCIHDQWRYQTSSGEELKITQEKMDELYVNARLHEGDVRQYDGGWSPAVR